MIGVLVGAQREHAKLSPHLGIREFVLCAAVGAACGLQQMPVLSAVALAALILVLLYFRFRSPAEDSGLTTDLSMLAVFCLAHVCTITDSENARSAAIGVSIVITFLLESKDKVRKFFSETLTRQEFSGTLLFLALVFIIYPILPIGEFGPFGGFNPRNIWTFVILVSSVSFGGYFLEKYLGRSRGLKITAVLGGIASTTAATVSLAKEVRQAPEKLPACWQAATLANAIQYPRLLAFLSAISPTISFDAAVPLLLGGIVGIVMAYMIPGPEGDPSAKKDSSAAPSNSGEETAQVADSAKSEQVSTLAPSEPEPEVGDSEGPIVSAESSVEGTAAREIVSKETTEPQAPAEMASFKIRNPLTLGPALECGMILALVVFVNKAAVATLGPSSLMWTSMIGGLVDVDAIAVSAADLFREQKIVPDTAVASVLLSILMNAVFKTGVAYTAGSRDFAIRMAFSFAVMLATAGLALRFL
ncbi:MAG: DUF4010 domain-containing protein [Candidatus Obscuribacterales bacterium]|jgi:uncharacterized membrane protein (DUF4010 family)|nr:DUF4010 domain-containing protein [Candidatus Obscuribacterales bacterium]